MIQKIENHGSEGRVLSKRAQGAIGRHILEFLSGRLA
jgi:hypothetical protein